MFIAGVVIMLRYWGGLEGISAATVYMVGFSVAMAGWLFWIYEFLDWRNDIYVITPDQIADINRKPMGKEDRREAPIKNIQSINFQRKGLPALILNYGTVNIQIGNEKFTFDNVYNPSEVQRQLFKKFLAYQENSQAAEREQMADWLEAYQELTTEHIKRMKYIHNKNKVNRRGSENRYIAAQDGNMASRNRTVPNEVLRRKARRVTVFDRDFQALVDEMIELLRAAPGWAWQRRRWGVSNRLIVIEDGTMRMKRLPKNCMWLPTLSLLKPLKTEMGVEGCLSVPGFVGEVNRFARVVVRDLTAVENRCASQAEGWLARIFHMRWTHLDGVLYNRPGWCASGSRVMMKRLLAADYYRRTVPPPSNMPKVGCAVTHLSLITFVYFPSGCGFACGNFVIGGKQCPGKDITSWRACISGYVYIVSRFVRPELVNFQSVDEDPAVGRVVAEYLRGERSTGLRCALILEKTATAESAFAKKFCWMETRVAPAGGWAFCLCDSCRR